MISDQWSHYDISSLLDLANNLSFNCGKESIPLMDIKQSEILYFCTTMWTYKQTLNLHFFRVIIIILLGKKDKKLMDCIEGNIRVSCN